MKKTVLVACVLSLGAGLAFAADQATSDGAEGRGERLRSLDKDGDGRVSRAEAQQAATERADRMFERLDGDKDGYVTEAEMQAARESRRADMQSRMDERFRSADSDGDGAISKSEAEQGMPMLSRHFDQLDADKDGRVTREEMRAQRGKHRKGGQG